MRRTLAIVAFALASVVLFVYGFQKGAPFGWVEAIGFITGALCVWLTIYENVWNFPVGIANCVFLGVLFLGQRLWADTGLQVLFIALGLQGWWLWLYGGAHRTELPTSRASHVDLWQGIAFVALTLPPFAWYLKTKDDGAPLWDATITVLSVVAQVLLNRKRLENWWVWLVVDVISVGLYIDKRVYLTAMLYALYCGMALMGYVAWRKDLAPKEPAPA